MKSEYQLFFCDTSGAHEPVVSFESESPFPTLFVGQRVDDHGWDRLRGVGVLGSEENPIRYTVHSLKSVVFVENGKNIIQSWVNLKPYSGERSPVFGNTEPAMSSSEALGK
ncbi:hypothetical protein [Neptuniibacter sp. 2_MG-2023]|jgi:hypothetical protein|uniref:hypothetical protein n=1 Tax=Neptuniibacter sp. 2_MG-2023 TaxID=3062671 RepID=UPI0026E1A8D6|nr:hypothetical protein [Neptuniibacter sp. 2_MG-2023]MDO6514305.1 hypothetical protein [Neptuniibacter sp. 2_MG-2023]